MTPTDSTRVHCVDPETFAAWVDGGLSAPDAAEVETHLASCARCQAMLAAFAQTDGVATPTATVLPFWSRRRVQSVAAVLVAAASLTLWMMTRPVPPAPIPSVPPPVQMAEAPRTVEPVAPPATAPKAVAPAAKKAPSPPATPAPPPPPMTVTTMPTPGKTTAVISARQEMSAISMPADVTRVFVPFEVVASVPQNAPSVPSTGAGADVLARGAGRGGAGRSVATSGTTAAFTSGTARPAARWRVTGGTIVERSLDMGATWEPVTLDPPFVLSAGSAPFQNVCWFVGQDGVVFRTTNGTSFERMTAPDNVHLTSIVARDASLALATSSDGRVFETTNGGVSWVVK